MTSSTTPTCVLVHGAFADASGWAGVIRELQTADRMVQAPRRQALEGSAVEQRHAPSSRAIGHG